MTAHYETLTADDILKIKSPYELFRSKFNHTPAARKLRQMWHPDRNPNPLAGDVLRHLNELIERADNGDWGNVLTVFDLVSDTKQYHFRYKKKRDIDVGSMYVGTQMVLFDVPTENEDLYRAGVLSIQGVKYPSKMIENNFTRFVPRELQQYKSDAGLVVTMYKNQDQVCLADLIEAKYEFKPGHLSWIITGLYNFALFMEQAQHRMFGGLSLDSIFVNPKFRTIHVLGGWWFSQRIDSLMVGLPNWLVPHVPKSIITSKKSTTVVDQIAIRCLALRLLGDTTMVGSSLLHDKQNKSIVQFLRSSPQETLIKDYGEWLKIEKDLPRLDVLMTFNDLYQQ